jgi:Fungalysin metallopeptidase (M36)
VPINFIPNDPLAVRFVPMRTTAPRRNRPASKAGFQFFDGVPSGEFPPGTPGFLFWQCREAALTSTTVWEQLHASLTTWSAEAVNRKKLKLVQDGGDDLNAFYDREQVAFFHHRTRTRTTFSGASTDVVAHELGHAFLDVVRPELFGSNVTEHGAFHEAFADCIAILVALFDQKTRKALLARSPDLGTANFVEGTAEDLSDGVRRALGASHPAAKPRRALNKFQYQLPTTLPTSGPPDQLTSEIHSFGRIFSGCFYDTIRNIFNSAPAAKNDAALLKAVKTAGKLLVNGAAQAPLAVRFFQSVGRAMVLADDATNRGVNRAAIGQAFAGHGVQLGSSSALLPKTSLAGFAPKTGNTSARLSPATLTDIRRRLGASAGTRFAVTPVRLGAEPVVEVVHQRAVPLRGLSRQLAAVVAMAPEAIVVGRSGQSAAAFSAIPDPATTTDEVAKFVETLLAHDRIDFGGRRRSRLTDLPTHRVVTVGKKKILTRIRFIC